MKLKNKNAIITGGSRGIAKGIAEKYASEGANIIIFDILEDAGNEAAKELAEKYNVKTLFFKVDVTDETSVDSSTEEAEKTLGPIDILVHCAGIQTIAPIIDFEYAQWKRLIDIHLHGGFLTSRAAMRSMKASGKGGCIILMGSIHSVEASPNKAAYVAAKHALLGLNRSIAKEGAQFNIRSTLIAPGFVKTALVEKQIPEQAKSLGISEEEVVKKVMLGKTVDGTFTTIEDVAEIAFFFAVFPTNALTGQSLLVTHGWHMQ